MAALYEKYKYGIILALGIIRCFVLEKGNWIGAHKHFFVYARCFFLHDIVFLGGFFLPFSIVYLDTLYC